MNKLYIILLVLLAGFAAVMLVNFGSNASVYTDFKHAMDSGYEVHVIGTWVQRESVQYDAGIDQFTFFLQDTTQTTAKVIYNDPMPPNFESADRIVVQGSYHDGAFYADKIHMKCPSKYNTTDLEKK